MDKIEEISQKLICSNLKNKQQSLISIARMFWIDVREGSVNLDDYELKTLDFPEYEKYSFAKYRFVITKNNPFKNMSNDDWEKYVSEREPHFTSEPHYENIPWEKLFQIETDAKAAGWELILRTTNNTAYCYGHVGQDWHQTTQWIFGYPKLQFLIILEYSEDRWSLTKKEGEKPPIKNYFSLSVIATTNEKTVQTVLNNSDVYSDDEYFYDVKKYFAVPKPSNGWIQNGGMMDENGTSNFHFIYQKPNDKVGDFEITDLMDEQIPPSFWKDWIENNKADLLQGKFKTVQITNWSNTFVLPGNQFNIECSKILQIQMNYLYIQKFMKSNINKWINYVFGSNSLNTINWNYWTPILHYNDKMNREEYDKKVAIIETKTKIKKFGKEEVEWLPFNQYENNLFSQEEIRLSVNAQELIKQAWTYIKANHQVS